MKKLCSETLDLEATFETLDLEATSKTSSRLKHVEMKLETKVKKQNPNELRFGTRNESQNENQSKDYGSLLICRGNIRVGLGCRHEVQLDRHVVRHILRLLRIGNPRLQRLLLSSSYEQKDFYETHILNYLERNQIASLSNGGFSRKTPPSKQLHVFFHAEEVS